MSTWVLLRGLIRESRHWGPFPELLQAQVPDAQIVTLDLPGNGYLYQSVSPTRIEQMAGHCRQTLRDRGLAPPYHLLTLSMGGMVAAAWERACPEEIAAAVLISSSMRPHSPFYRRLRPANYPAVIGMALLPRRPRRDEAAILRMTSCRGDQQPQLLAEWTAYAWECPVSRANAFRQLLAAARFRDTGVPRGERCLLLAGARDRLVDPVCSKNLASAWGADLAVHPEAGHDLPLDDGPWVATRVREWLEQRGAGQSA